ncbi:MAG: phosphoenolpyruvate synthase, partial [Lachnospiraceae bacterium]|nr:phosphoenolpyruvate synthase [Lachnospiraceae bacterium]
MYIKSFHEISKNDIPVAGGKGANLGEMTAAGINIPGGFVITADAYRLFIKENGYETIFLDVLTEAGNDETKLTGACAKLRNYILNGKIPDAVMSELTDHYHKLCCMDTDRVAVRSSATAEDLAEASFAGQQETYLGIRGLDEVTEAVRKCYTSLWGNRATIYRNNLGFDQNEVALAVVIQLMVASEKAGVLFTADPISSKTDAMRINSSWGLGESVVSGRVTADSVLCDKKGNILSYDCGSKMTQIIYAENATKEIPVDSEFQNARSLSDEEIRMLCAEGIRIEQHYGKPMDIEWAICGNTAYILQARPITTMGNDHSDDDSELIKSYLAGSKISGTAKSNMAFQLEKMPYAYRPLDYDLIMQINHQKSKIFAEAGLLLTSDPQMDDDGIMTLPSPKKGISRNIFHLPAVIKEVKDYEHCAEVCISFMPGYEKDLADYADISYETLSLRECSELFHKAYDLLGKLCYDRFKYALFPSALSGDLTKAVQKIDKKYTKYDLYIGLDNKTSVITREVAELAKRISKDKALTAAILSGRSFGSISEEYPSLLEITKDFMKENGFKSDFNCYCVEAKTLIEDPDRLLNIIKPLLNSSDQTVSADQLSYEELLDCLKSIYGSKYPKLKSHIEAFRTFHLVREESQYLWEMLFFYIRKILKRMNILLTGNEDYLHGISNLFYNELLDACSRGSLSEADLEKIRRRNQKHPLSQKVWDASKLLVFDSDGDT